MGKKLKEAVKRYKRLSFQTFKMDSGQFDHCINVIISEDLKRCAKYVNEKFKSDFSEGDFNCLGKVFFERGVYPILWLPRYPATISDQATLAHELLHLVFEVTSWAGVTHSSSSEETFTHLLGYYFKQFYSLSNA